jgi:hypothetical protein
VGRLGSGARAWLHPRPVGRLPVRRTKRGEAEATPPAEGAIPARLPRRGDG